MIEFIAGTISTLIAVLVGFYLGKSDRTIQKDIAKVVQTISKAIPQKKDVGAVTTLTQPEIDLQENPLKRAENEEMDKTFSEIIPK